jgi:hypothetical protein
MKMSTMKHKKKITLAGSFQNCKTDFNYRIINKKGRELLVHVNQLKKLVIKRHAICYSKPVLRKICIGRPKKV